MILFPAARLLSVVRVRLEEGATVLAGETVLAHDPEGRGGCFDQMRSELHVHTDGGQMAVCDRWIMYGERWTRPVPGVTGGHRVQGTLFILHRASASPTLIDRIRAVLPEHPRLYIGASRLPNDCGVMVRALASDEPLLQTTLSALRDVARTFFLEKGTEAQECSRSRPGAAG